jgi:hypothetical protein
MAAISSRCAVGQNVGKLDDGASGLAADFGKIIAEETDKWAKVIRAANIKVE